MIFDPRYIIVHHSLTKDSGTVSWQAIRDWHTGVNPDSKYKWSDIGYHFGIELVNDHYEILAGRMLDTHGAHTRGANAVGIGICCVGNFDLAPPPEEQFKLAVKLTKSLMKVFKIPRGHVHGHNHFANWKSCPGTLFDMQKFKRSIV